MEAVTRSVFPVKDSLEEVISFAESKLPITSKNELLALLAMYHNTLLKVLGPRCPNKETPLCK